MFDFSLKNAYGPPATGWDAAKMRPRVGRTAAASRKMGGCHPIAISKWTKSGQQTFVWGCALELASCTPSICSPMKLDNPCSEWGLYQQKVHEAISDKPTRPMDPVRRLNGTLWLVDEFFTALYHVCWWWFPFSWFCGWIVFGPAKFVDFCCY